MPMNVVPNLSGIDRAIVAATGMLVRLGVRFPVADASIPFLMVFGELPESKDLVVFQYFRNRNLSVVLWVSRNSEGEVTAHPSSEEGLERAWRDGFAGLCQHSRLRRDAVGAGEATWRVA